MNPDLANAAVPNQDVMAAVYLNQEAARLRAALEYISVLPDDLSKSAPDNMNRVRAIARAALK